MSKTSKSKEDASPLTTSTESESFDTWTVITDKTTDLLIPQEIPSPPPTPEKIEPDADDDDDEIGNRIETLKATENDDQSENRYADGDDLSDGISIISECESVGRISPHPELRKHLSELNMRFVDVIEPPLRMKNSEASRKYATNDADSSDVFHQVVAEPLMENNRRTRRASRHQLADTTDFQPTLRSGLRGLFYVGAVLGILAFVSKLKYESVLGDTNADVLIQKIDDLELKNNLMRAEIDILAKQVNYLTSLSENQKYSASNKPPKNNNNNNNNNQSSGKKMKVWPGNGNTVEEVEINKKDLKTPFKCDGHNNVDIAGVCMELPKSGGESVVDSLGEKVRSVIEESEHFANFEKVVEKVAKTAENPFGESNTDKPENTKPSHQKNDYTPHEHKSDKYDNKKYENKKYDNKNYDGKREHYKKHKNNDDHSGESRERFHRKDRSSEDYSGSGERFKKSKDYKKHDKYSSSEYENAKRDADGQWHEKLMQHRENSRKNNDKHRQDKNWYIERGDSREQARVSEQIFR